MGVRMRGRGVPAPFKRNGRGALGRRLLLRLLLRRLLLRLLLRLRLRRRRGARAAARAAGPRRAEGRDEEPLRCNEP